jgi:RimJ/RimL family protein N-acetyltransferase
VRYVVPDHKEHFAEWARVRVPHIECWGADYTTLGLIDESGQTLAAIVYTDYSRYNICMHIASEGKNWMTRAFLKAAFEYPFDQIKVDRVTAFVAKSNAASRRFVEHIGFIHEGVMRKAHHKDDLIVYGMLRDECRWVNHGQAIRALCA